jgi:hypothetical protein
VSASERSCCFVVAQVAIIGDRSRHQQECDVVFIEAFALGFAAKAMLAARSFRGDAASAAMRSASRHVEMLSR